MPCRDQDLGRQPGRGQQAPKGLRALPGSDAHEALFAARSGRPAGFRAACGCGQGGHEPFDRTRSSPHPPVKKLFHAMDLLVLADREDSLALETAIEHGADDILDRSLDQALINRRLRVAVMLRDLQIEVQALSDRLSKLQKVTGVEI